VDVNSGKFTSLQSQAETIKLTNLEACKEIARQLRLRNIGGMIVVDFIDMESRANQLTVLQSFENELSPDKAKPQIGQLSDLGLVEMTRHRQGQSLSEIFTRRCTSCNGTGHAPEEFSWMHAGGDGESRGRQSRNKLPLRQPNRMQQVPKPAASLNQRKDKPRVAMAIGDAAKKEAQSSVTPGNVLLNSLQQRKTNQPTPEPQETLVEHFSERIYKSLGIRFASAAKMSFMPQGINSILTRINPKANDIVTLVHSIETASTMPMTGHGLGHDYDDDEVDGDEDEDQIEAVSDSANGSPHVERERVGVGSRMPRSGRGRPAAAEPTDSEMGAEREFRAIAREEFPPAESVGFETDLEESAGEESLEDVRETAVVVAERPRRGRQLKRFEEEEAPETAELQPDVETVAEVAHDHEILHSDAEDTDEFPDEQSDDEGDDDALDTDENDIAGEDSTEERLAKSTGALAKPRRKGRPAKRSIKKPPAKR
jgi:hypothetical protein